MLTPMPSIRVTMYLAENHVPAVLDFLFAHNVAGATAVRAYAGFGSHHHMHTAQLVDISVDLPVILTIIESKEKLERWLPGLADVARGGLLSTQEVLVYRPPIPREADSGSLLR
jgi:uncharacterized protein